MSFKRDSTAYPGGWSRLRKTMREELINTINSEISYTDVLINKLSQLPQIKVIARSSSFKYKGKELDVGEVAKTLGVQAVITGRITQQVGSR